MPNIEEIRERCEKATAGPWMQKELADCSEIYDANSWGKALRPLALVGSSTIDAEFIAHAREDIPALLDHIEALHSELTKRRKLAEDYYQSLVDNGQFL